MFKIWELKKGTRAHKGTPWNIDFMNKIEEKSLYSPNLNSYTRLGTKTHMKHGDMDNIILIAS